MSDHDDDWMRGGRVMMYGAPSPPRNPFKPLDPLLPGGVWPNPLTGESAQPYVGTPPNPLSIEILRREMQAGFESVRASHRDSIEELTSRLDAFLKTFQEVSLAVARREAYEDAVSVCERVYQEFSRPSVDPAAAAVAGRCAMEIKARLR